MSQAKLFPAERRAPRQVAGPEGGLLRAWNVHHQEAGLGTYRMHGGDVRALRGLVAEHGLEKVTDWIGIYWEVVLAYRGTDEARYWRPTVCCFASTLPTLRARYVQVPRLTAEQARALNMGALHAYRAARDGEPESVNPFPPGTRRWAHWRLHHRYHNRSAP